MTVRVPDFLVETYIHLPKVRRRNSRSGNKDGRFNIIYRPFRFVQVSVCVTEDGDDK